MESDGFEVFVGFSLLGFGEGDMEEDRVFLEFGVDNFVGVVSDGVDILAVVLLFKKL